MKIAIIGTKGLPATYGGFETFAWNLSRFLILKGNQVTVVNEKGISTINEIEGIKILYSKYQKSKNPLKFYYNSLKLVKKHHDIVLVCGVGGAFFYKVINGKAIIVTNVDGLEHLRRKYTLLQRFVVKILQKASSIFSDYIIADSDQVKIFWSTNFRKSRNKISAICYGADIPEKFDSVLLDKYAIFKNQYYLVVARIVPENNIKMILDAFSNYRGSKKLVVVGEVNDNNYSKEFATVLNEKINFFGSIYNKPMLDSLRINSFAYIHGHSVGGTNPALLEAMACECICLCHDNVFNREVTKNEQLYFDAAVSLKLLVENLETMPDLIDYKSKAKSRVIENYSWEQIGNQYVQLFDLLIKKGK